MIEILRLRCVNSIGAEGIPSDARIENVTFGSLYENSHSEIIPGVIELLLSSEQFSGDDHLGLIDIAYTYTKEHDK